MELKIEKKTGRLIIDDARIIFRNFEGRGVITIEKATETSS